MKDQPALADDITEVNLSYLILAQQLIRADKATALYRLGISEQVGEVIDSLKPSQLLKIARSNTLICQIRCADDLVWRLLADHAKADESTNAKTAAQIHAQVLLAGKHSEVI